MLVNPPQLDLPAIPSLPPPNRRKLALPECAITKGDRRLAKEPSGRGREDCGNQASYVTQGGGLDPPLLARTRLGPQQEAVQLPSANETASDGTALLMLNAGTRAQANNHRYVQVPSTEGTTVRFPRRDAVPARAWDPVPPSGAVHGAQGLSTAQGLFPLSDTCLTHPPSAYNLYRPSLPVQSHFPTDDTDSCELGNTSDPARSSACTFTLAMPRRETCSTSTEGPARHVPGLRSAEDARGGAFRDAARAELPAGLASQLAPGTKPPEPLEHSGRRAPGDEPDGSQSFICAHRPGIARTGLELREAAGEPALRRGSAGSPVGATPGSSAAADSSGSRGLLASQTTWGNAVKSPAGTLLGGALGPAAERPAGKPPGTSVVHPGPSGLRAWGPAGTPLFMGNGFIAEAGAVKPLAGVELWGAEGDPPSHRAAEDTGVTGTHGTAGKPVGGTPPPPLGTAAGIGAVEPLTGNDPLGGTAGAFAQKFPVKAAWKPLSEMEAGMGVVKPVAGCALGNWEGSKQGHWECSNPVGNKWCQAVREPVNASELESLGRRGVAGSPLGTPSGASLSAPVEAGGGPPEKRGEGGREEQGCGSHRWAVEEGFSNHGQLPAFAFEFGLYSLPATQVGRESKFGLYSLPAAQAGRDSRFGPPFKGRPPERLSCNFTLGAVREPLEQTPIHFRDQVAELQEFQNQTERLRQEIDAIRV